MEKFPFSAPDGSEIGVLMVERKFIVVRQYRFKPDDSNLESRRALFELELARVAPPGCGLIATQKNAPPDDATEAAEGYLYDRYIFVKRGSFVFRTRDGLPPHRFTLRTRSDGMPYYTVERDG